MIPDCGADHGAIKAFPAAGFEVTAMDFSTVALAQSTRALGNSDVKLMRADFFNSDFGRRFELVYASTFLCAMHPRRSAGYAKRVAELLRPGGKLIGICFYGTEPEPPKDAEFFRKLRQRGRIALLSSRLISSPRRYEQIGPWTLTLTYGIIALLYFLRVPNPILARIYRKICFP